METSTNRKVMFKKAFTLAEVVIAVVVGAMVLVTMWSVYGHAQKSAAAVTRKLDTLQLPNEIQQGIAEDLDRIIASGSDTKITVENKVIDGYPAARLAIKRTIEDGKGKENEFETIIWQSSYDYDSDANGLTLYRSHTGINLEDKLLDEGRADWEKAYPFVPVCSRVTCFTVQIPMGEQLIDRWTNPKLPRGLIVSLSFAEPIETAVGTWEVLEEEKITRAVAIDRTRKVRFTVVMPSLEEEGVEENGEEAAEEEEDKTEDEESEEDEGRVTPGPNEPVSPRRVR
jgi:hypothetical protein